MCVERGGGRGGGGGEGCVLREEGRGGEGDGEVVGFLCVKGEGEGVGCLEEMRV